MAQIKKAAGQTAASKITRPDYSSLAPLIELRSNGVMPKSGLIWLGLGLQPPKRNSIAINPDHLPSDHDCMSVAGLEVVVCIYGHDTKYRDLRRLCGSLYAARPRRLLVIDLDYKKVAFLRLGGRQ